MNEGTPSAAAPLTGPQIAALLTGQDVSVDTLRTTAWSSKTANFTAADTDAGYLIDSTTAAITATLPTAVGRAGRRWPFKFAAGANLITIATTSSQTIDGLTGYALSVLHEDVVIYSDGANWRIER